MLLGDFLLLLELLSEGLLFLGEVLLLEMQLVLAFDCEFVVRDTKAEPADAVI